MARNNNYPCIVKLEMHNYAGYQARLDSRTIPGNTKYHAIEKYGRNTAKELCRQWITKQKRKRK